MADLHFKCLGCDQSLVADESGAGLIFHCPHCARPQEIPAAVKRNGAPHKETLAPARAAAEVPAREMEPARRPTPTAEEGLRMAQERLWQNENLSAEQTVALAERDQRISAIAAERDWLVGQLDEERQRRQTLEPELDVARAEWAAAEKRAGEFETGYALASSRLAQMEMDMAHLSKQLDTVKSERTEAVLELTRKQEEFGELSLKLERAHAERVEFEQIVGRARKELEIRAALLAEAQAAAEQSSVEMGKIQADLVLVRTELGAAAAQRDKLQAAVQEDHDLSEFLDMKADRERLEGELRESQTRFGGVRERLQEVAAERDGLKRETTELRLTIAALREVHAGEQLEQDNEVLRRMVERLNEELKELRPAGAKRKRRTDAGGLIGEMAKAALARCFVPDPEL